MGYLNINSVPNKIADLRIIIQNIPLDYHVLSEMKLDESYPNTQLKLDGYEIKARWDRDNYGGGFIMGDFNIDLKIIGFGFNKLDEFCHLCNLTNLKKNRDLFH